MGSLFLNPPILFDRDSHPLRIRVGPEGTKIFGKNGPAQLVAAWGEHRCGLSVLCKEKNGEDGSFSNLALKKWTIPILTVPAVSLRVGAKSVLVAVQLIG